MNLSPSEAIRAFHHRARQRAIRPRGVGFSESVDYIIRLRGTYDQIYQLRDSVGSIPPSPKQ